MPEQIDDSRRGRDALASRLQAALQEQMGLVERVQQLDAEKISLAAQLAEAISTRDAKISALQAGAASSHNEAGSMPAATSTAAASGWGGAADKLDSLMELLAVTPEGDRASRAGRACERVKELRALSARSAERVRQLEALRAEQVGYSVHVPILAILELFNPIHSDA